MENDVGQVSLVQQGDQPNAAAPQNKQICSGCIKLLPMTGGGAEFTLTVMLKMAFCHEGHFRKK